MDEQTRPPTGRILVVDDEVNVLESIRLMLSRQGHDVATAPNAYEAFERVESFHPDLTILDINLPSMNGLEAFQQIKQAHPRMPVIIMTAHGTTETAIEATKLGAFEYLLKPFNPPEMLKTIESALAAVELMDRQVSLDTGKVSNEEDALIGQSPDMQEVYKTIGRVAPTDATVLIRGATGVGKELVARAIYQHSQRSDKPLLIVNCAALPESLLESELFGHERGAFTGAHALRIGKFEKANGGTLFLDEIGDIPPSVQPKILRVLQSLTFQRVGGSENIQVDVRVIAATNRDLEAMMREGEYREDLYHRLNVVSIHIQPLGARPESIPELTDYFVRLFSEKLGLDPPPLSPAARETLLNYSWPGNVRELRHSIHRALIHTQGRPIQDSDIRRALESGTETRPNTADHAERNAAGGVRALVARHLDEHTGTMSHRELLEAVDRELVIESLRRTEGNQTQAAKLLGLTRPTLLAKMSKYGIQKEVSFRADPR